MKELIAIQSKLKAPKNQFNKFGNYKYRNAEDILEAVKPLLEEQKCTLTISDELVVIDGWHYIKATTTLKNSEGEIIQTCAFAREEESKKGMDGSQVTGSSSSYARKYALNGLFCIDDTKDADATNTHGKETAPAPQPKVTSKKEEASKPTTEQVKEQLKVSEDTESITLEQVIEMVKNANDKSELSSIWKRYKVLFGEDKSFVEAIKTSPLNPNRK